MRTVLAELDVILQGRSSAAKLETSTLDFKEPKANTKDAWSDLAECAVCFANSSGGTIVVGVTDKDCGPDAFVGCDLGAETLRARIHQLTSPPLLVEVREFTFAGKRLLEIRVPEGLEVYSTSKGHTYRRINTDCVPMRPADISRLSEERRGIDWSAATTDQTIDDVDPFALRYCRRLLSSSADPARQRYAAFSDADLLRALKLTRDEKLTRAGELLLCTDAAVGPNDAIVTRQRAGTRRLAVKDTSTRRTLTPVPQDLLTGTPRHWRHGQQYSHPRVTRPVSPAGLGISRTGSGGRGRPRRGPHVPRNDPLRPRCSADQRGPGAGVGSLQRATPQNPNHEIPVHPATGRAGRYRRPDHHRLAVPETYGQGRHGRHSHSAHRRRGPSGSAPAGK